MATLAQEMLETGWTPQLSDIARNYSHARVQAMKENGRLAYIEDGLNALGVVRDALRPPGPDATPAEMAFCAERYVFSFDGPDQVAQMVEDGMIDQSIPFETADLPAPRVWLEWRVSSKRAEEMIKIGVLLDADHKDNLAGEEHYGFSTATRFIACVSTKNSEPRVFFVAYGPEFPMESDRWRKIDGAWRLGLRWLEGSPDVNALSTEVSMIAREAIFCLFLIITPRVSEYREVEWGPKLQRKRLQQNKLPLLEYREVRILVGMGEVRTRRVGSSADPSSPETKARRRLHRVVGHFRIIDREGRKRAIWIPQHVRGDAALGILLHNRTISGGKK